MIDLVENDKGVRQDADTGFSVKELDRTELIRFVTYKFQRRCLYGADF